MARPSISVTHMADPGCPWAYSALPAVTTLRWRYRDQLDWRIVTIGLTEQAEQYERRGYTPARMAATPLRFARLGMPYGAAMRPRVMATGRACRAVVAARALGGQELAYRVLRALSLAWFTSDALLDQDEGISGALEDWGVEEPDRVVAALAGQDVEDLYQRDRAEARSAEGSPSSLQERTAQTDGPERYTAPTLIFTREGQTLEAGGHQPLAAYDLLVANLAPQAEVRPPARSAEDVLADLAMPLATREIATAMAGHDEEPDDDAVTAELLEAEHAGRVGRLVVGPNAVWWPRQEIGDPLPAR